ncbi:MAG: hypothetical protein DYG94_09895 [Leptolyngbya sp. PLA3]|nr:MAG: hypothetical protein EDM82_05040 [Cyanobacteria bacterium CYA]MCE7969042.1 hypothetical protein [Leptolyngbya sp. PL-A3]
MNGRLSRFPTLCVFSGCFVVVAAWYFGVHQRWAIVEDLRHELEAQQAVLEQEGIDDASVQRVNAMLEHMGEEAAFYQQCWRSAYDSAALYEELDVLAAGAGVQLVRIEPSKSGMQLHRKDANVNVEGFIIEVQGPYADVAEFIGRVHESTGLTRFKSLRVYPSSTGADSGGIVVATMQTEHVAVSDVFTLGEDSQ